MPMYRDICLLVNVFLLASSVFLPYEVLGAWASEGGPPGFLNLTFSHHIFSKKVVFLVSSGENLILPLLPSCNNILTHPWKIHC